MAKNRPPAIGFVGIAGTNVNASLAGLFWWLRNRADPVAEVRFVRMEERVTDNMIHALRVGCEGLLKAYGQDKVQVKTTKIAISPFDAFWKQLLASLHTWTEQDGRLVLDITPGRKLSAATLALLASRIGHEKVTLLYGRLVDKAYAHLPFYLVPAPAREVTLLTEEIGT